MWWPEFQFPATGHAGDRRFRKIFFCLFGVGGSERGGCGFSFTDGSLQLFLRPKYFLSLSHKQRARERV